VDDKVLKFRIIAFCMGKVMELLQNMGIEHPCVQKYDRRYLLRSLSKALGGEDRRSAT
jgi:hypothetical protein